MSGSAVAGAMVLAAFWSAAPASAACGSLIGDPAPGYLGSYVKTSCGYEDGPFAWTAWPSVSAVTFSARGADDAGGGKSGGSVEATLPVTPGQTYVLEAGGAGNASTISLDSTPVLVAGGGNGSVANYIAPGAADAKSQDPGAPLAGGARDGEVSITVDTIMKDPNWKDPTKRETDGCVVPQLRGMRPVAARKLLAEAGCTTGQVRRRAARRRVWGRITMQWPVANTELPSGGAVAFRVGRKRA